MGISNPQLIKRAGALSNYILAEDGSTQIALFTYASNVSTLEGGSATGDDLILKANSIDTTTSITLEGAGDIIIDTSDDIYFKKSGTAYFNLYENTGSFFHNPVANTPIVFRTTGTGDIRYYQATTYFTRFEYSSNLTTISGGNVTGDDIKIQANTTDTYPFIALNGDSRIQLASKTDLQIYIESTEVARFNDDGALHLLECDTPTAITNYGALYFKNDNKLYAQDGAGVEHEVAYA